jgi:DNA-directed RNA polymerase subunit H (RpoH/RPB5)|tara:strand:- start:318 stop:1004 length:687 start_codon:yes stop_codon:yes gene_type:complete
MQYIKDLKFGYIIFYSSQCLFSIKQNMSKVDPDRIWKVYSNIKTMLKARGFKGINMLGRDELVECVTTPGFCRHRLDCIVDAKLMLFFCDVSKRPKIGVVVIRNALEKMVNRGIKNAMFILKSNLTSQGLSAIREVNASGYAIEYFNDRDLYFNITEHELASPHRIITEEETTSLLEKYKTTLAYLPKIYDSDPMAKYYGAKVGQVVEITRLTETAGHSLYYRTVISG